MLGFLSACLSKAVANYISYIIYLLDINKGFDRVPHVRLIKKVEVHGMGEYVLKWIKEWLTDRKQNRLVANQIPVFGYGKFIIQYVHK